MTRRLYETDSTCRQFTATVLSCAAVDDGFAVELDATAFFPEGGGQPADTGWLGAAAVTDVQIKEDRLLHYTDKPLPVEATVSGTLDWGQRFRRMQKHTAEHILSGLIHARYGYDNVGFHLGHEDVTLDFNGELTRAQLNEIEERANEVVAENRPVRAFFPTEEEAAALAYRSKKEVDGPLRIVTVEGVDTCACCAPHVPSTALVGVIKMLDFIRYKGGIRIHMQAGLDALADYRMRYNQTASAAALLSVKQDTLTDAVEHLLDEKASLKTALRESRRQVATMQVAAVEPTDLPVCLFGEDWDADTMRQLVNGLSARCSGICAVFSAAGEAYRYVIGGQGDLPAFCHRMHAALGGRGGGSPAMQQGQVPAGEGAIRAFFAE